MTIHGALSVRDVWRAPSTPLVPWGIDIFWYFTVLLLENVLMVNYGAAEKKWVISKTSLTFHWTLAAVNGNATHRKRQRKWQLFLISLIVIVVICWSERVRPTASYFARLWERNLIKTSCKKVILFPPSQYLSGDINSILPPPAAVSPSATSFDLLMLTLRCH